MKEIIFGLIVKVVGFILAGVFLSKMLEEKKERLISYFVNIAVYTLVPAYIVLSLWTSPIYILSVKTVLFVSFAVTAAGYLFSLIFAQLTKSKVRDVCLPVMFMNSAYLGIPICTFLWGENGGVYAIMYSAVLTLIHFSFGVLLVGYKESVWEIFRLPFLYAVLLGVALNLFSVPSGMYVTDFNVTVSNITLPLMLLFTGFRLGELKVHIFQKAVTAVVLRMAGGFTVSFLIIYFFEVIDPVTGGTCILLSSMPAAVNSFILAEKYNADPEYTSASIFLGTSISLFVIPIIYGLISNYYK